MARHSQDFQCQIGAVQTRHSLRLMHPLVVHSVSSHKNESRVLSSEVVKINDAFFGDDWNNTLEEEAP